MCPRQPLVLAAAVGTYSYLPSCRRMVPCISITYQSPSVAVQRALVTDVRFTVIPKQHTTFVLNIGEILALPENFEIFTLTL